MPERNEDSIGRCPRFTCQFLRPVSISPGEEPISLELPADTGLYGEVFPVTGSVLVVRVSIL